MKLCQGVWVDTVNPPEAVPCKWCGKPTAMLGTKMCDRCWELDGQIRRDLEIAIKIIKSITHNPQKP